MMRKILLGCGIAASVLYIAMDIIASLRYPGYRYFDQEFSELTANGSPVRTLILTLNVIPGTVLSLAFAVGIWQAADGRGAGRVTAALFAGFALAGTVTGTLFPMHTRAALATGEDGFRNTMHPIGTIVMDLLLVAAMGIGATLLGRRFRYYTYGTILTLVVFGVQASLQVNRMAANQPTPWMGLEERINIYATMLWVVVLAVALLRTPAERFAVARGTPTSASTAQPLTPSARGES